MMLPDMNGVTVFKAIRENNPEAKICFLSGSESAIREAEDMLLGAIGYLVKPIFLEDVQKIIKMF